MLLSQSNRVKFTVPKVENFASKDGKEAFMWDSDTPGLGLRVTGKGGKSYVFRYNIGNRRNRLTIGSFQIWTLPAARQEARRLHQLLDQGEDPRKARKALRDTEGANSLYFKDVFEQYLKANKTRWSDRHYDDNLFHARPNGGVLWPMLQKRLADIDQQTVNRWAQNVASEPVKGYRNQGKSAKLRHGFMRLRAAWRWAYERDEYHPAMASPDIFSNSILRTLVPAASPKRDALTKVQLKAWFDTVQKIGNPYISAYLQILLLTGARRNELTRLKWSDIDTQWKTIWLHDKVEADGRVIPLTPYVEFLISRLKKKKKWVFYSERSKSKHIEEPRIQHKKALAEAGITDLSLHGLRRSFTTLSEWIGAPKAIIEQIQGHKPQTTSEKHYTVRPVDLLAVWHNKFEEFILANAEIQFDAEAVQEGLHVVK